MKGLTSAGSEITGNKTNKIVCVGAALWIENDHYTLYSFCAYKIITISESNQFQTRETMSEPTSSSSPFAT